jgi:hypothetical protein
MCKHLGFCLGGRFAYLGVSLDAHVNLRFYLFRNIFRGCSIKGYLVKPKKIEKSPNLYVKCLLFEDFYQLLAFSLNLSTTP